MIIARLIKPDTERYLKARKLVSQLDWLKLLRWDLFFMIWTFLLAGLGAAGMQNDRFLYWNKSLSLDATLLFIGVTFLLMGLFGLSNRRNIEASDLPGWARNLFWLLAILGIISLLISHLLVLLPVALLILVLGPLSGFSPFNLKQRSMKNFLILASAAALLFLTGWLFKDGIISVGLWRGIPYLLGFWAVLLVYWIPLEVTEQNLPLKLSDNRLRLLFLIIALLLTAGVTVLGFLNDDPVLSTAACVYLPFLVVALLFPPHFRHILRCRIYPIFILCMLVAVQQPWFLLPLGLNFWLLRSYHYLQSGFPRPTFRVDYD